MTSCTSPPLTAEPMGATPAFKPNTPIRDTYSPSTYLANIKAENGDMLLADKMAKMSCTCLGPLLELTNVAEGFMLCDVSDMSLHAEKLF